MLPDTFVERLDIGDCWLWTGHLNTRGYGRFYAGADKAGRYA